MPDVGLSVVLIVKGQLDVQSPFKRNNSATIFLSFFSAECLFFISLLTLLRERVLSTNLSWVSHSMGGQFSLKLGVCDRIVYFFFCFDSSLSLSALHRPAKGGLTALAWFAFVVDAHTPWGFSVSSSLRCSAVCTRRSHVSWVRNIFYQI